MSVFCIRFVGIFGLFMADNKVRNADTMKQAPERYKKNHVNSQLYINIWCKIWAI